MIRSQIKKYPRKVLSFGKRIIKKINSITGADQNTHVHIQKQTSEKTEEENSNKENSDQTNNFSKPIQSHSTNEEVKIGSVQEDLQKEDVKQSKNVSEKINKEEPKKEEPKKEESHVEESSSIKTVVSLSSYESSNPNTDDKKSSLETELIIDPEPTPNPNCYKFTLNTNIGRSFSCSPTENPTHHIGAPLLTIDGIVSVFGVNNFLVMNKEVNRNWDDLVEPVVEKIEEVLG